MINETQFSINMNPRVKFQLIILYKKKELTFLSTKKKNFFLSNHDLLTSFVLFCKQKHKTLKVKSLFNKKKYKNR